ncbi:F-box protein GID2 [Zea mays]|jgi:F-box protein GID2|uniref:F-box protein GID2 n=1 Tax=Zea mays TaxID=4577 RepID=A0A1D6HBI7_MAIZE|nr:F-box protein GID2 [Zea mays]AQK72065.1 F-box protein GID2 [Zea mays]|eukprot:NP_001149408.2 F-box protein GID2 [Zea mays]
MKCRSDAPGGGDGHRDRAPAPVATGVGGSPPGERSKKQRTEEPSSSSSVVGECSSSSSQALPPPLPEQLLQDAGVGEQPPPGPEPAGGEQARVPDLGEDLVFEVLMRAEARTLAAAACVSRGWRLLARDERLWEAACVREWACTGFSEQMLRSVVLPLGGFRRLHEMYIRPVQRRAAGAPRGQQRRQLPVRMGRDQVQVSLSLLSTSFFLKMPNAPPPPPKDKDKDGDKNGGGQCG